MNAGERNTSPSSPELIDIAALWRGRWLLVLSVAASVGLGALWLRQATPLYEAEARLLIRDEGPFEPEQRQRDDRFFMATQAEIIRSPVTIRRALES
ncbi:MAG: hypothetical protein KY476_25410, partial [Planctomycetes bacterium]|nr:hypothetical protein [Planctomycetota bacterium]